MAPPARQADRVSAVLEVSDAAMRLADLMAQLEPPPSLTVSQWADAERRLAVGASSKPGPWRTEPYQRGILDAIHEGADTIVVMAAAQTVKTEMLLNLIGYHIAHDPAPILLVEPTEGLAKRISKHRVAPMLRDTPSLAARVGDGRGRKAASTLLMKQYPGGRLVLAGANSPTPLASEPIRIVLLDEIDKYPPYVGDEGDPVSLALKRSATYWNRLHVLTSTPTLTGASRIESWFELSDQRRRFLPCPRCGHLFVLEWKHVRWDGGRAGDPETAHLLCPVESAGEPRAGCGGRIEGHEVPAMDADPRAEWRATAPFRGVIGFAIWELYSPRANLAGIVRNFLSARARGIEALREWVNQTLGEPWQEETEKADPAALISRREPYTVATIPREVVLVVAGIDTQDDRLEVTSRGYGLGEESWTLEHRVLRGDPARPEVWRDLDAVLMAPALDVDGRHRHILAACIDSAGHRTDAVYAYAAPRLHHVYECPRCGMCTVRVFATIGRAGWTRPIVDPDPTKLEITREGRTVLLYTVGVDQAKLLVTANLNLTARGPGYTHLPTSVDEEYLAQLAGEQLHEKKVRGYPMREWRAHRPRVEALDCAVLALAALRLLNPRLEALAEALRVTPTQEPEAPAPSAPSAPRLAAQRVGPAPRRVARSVYLGRGP